MEFKCGHIDCGRDMRTDPHNHLCVPFYRSKLRCEELNKFILNWVANHSDVMVNLLAEDGIGWAKEQRREQIYNDMKIGSL